MRRLLLDPRARRVGAVSVVLWLALGWVWRDDWLWTVVRALALPLAILGIVALYASRKPVARIARVAVGPPLGGYCAYQLEGDLGVVLVVALLFGVLLLGAELLITREQGSRTSG